MGPSGFPPTFAGQVKKAGPKRPEAETQEFVILVTFASSHESLDSWSIAFVAIRLPTHFF